MDTYEAGIGDLSNSNKYLYAGSNPVINIDPLGLFLVSPGYSVESATQSALEKLHTTQKVATFQTIKGRLILVGGAVATALAKALEVSVTSARTLNRQFGIPVVFWGNDLPETTDHQFRSVMGQGYTIDNVSGGGLAVPISPALHRREKEHSRSWLYSQPQAVGRSKGVRDTDEYPYAITEEGGRANYFRGKVSLRVLNASQNRSNGSRLRTFMNRANVTPIEQNLRYSLFLNIPVPALGVSFGLGRDGKPISVYDGG